MKTYFPVLACVFFVSFGTPSRANGPEVVVSIAPIHSLVSAVMENLGEPKLIYSSSGSPHSQQLSPSSVQNLYSADLLFWIGEEFEVGMNSYMDNLKTETDVVTLIHEGSLQVLKNRQSSIDQEHGQEHSHEHGQLDPHIWLSVANAIAVLNITSQKLSTMDPANAETYRSNAQSTINRISGLKENIENELEEVTDVSFVVYHDAYQYFENEFNLSFAGSLLVDQSIPAGAKTVKLLRDHIVSENVKCVFSEPQFEPALVDVLTENTAAISAELDPVGVNLTHGKDLWFELIKNLSDSFKKCLG